MQTPAAPAGARTTLATAAPAAPVSFAQAIANNLERVFHLTAVGAAGFLGSFKIESNFRANAYNPGENAHGIAQWENGRWSGSHGLQAYAAAHHENPLTPAAQIGFLDYELSHGYSGVISNLRGVTDVNQAAQIVQSQYEGSTVDSLPARQAAARSFYSQLSAGRPVTGGTTYTGGADSAGAAGFAGSSAWHPSWGTPGNPPYDPATLHPPLSKTQRGVMNAWMTAYALTHSGSVPKRIPDDSTLITAYTGMVHAWELEHQPITGPSGVIGDWINGIENSIIKPAGRAIVDGLLILGGLIAVLVAVIVISKAGGRSSSAPAPTNSGAGGGGRHHGKRGDVVDQAAGDILDA